MTPMDYYFTLILPGMFFYHLESYWSLSHDYVVLSSQELFLCYRPGYYKNKNTLQL